MYFREASTRVNEGKVGTWLAGIVQENWNPGAVPQQILSGEFNRKPKKSTATAFKVKPAIYKKYFTTSISQKEFDSIVDEALASTLLRKDRNPSKRPDNRP